jgi:hypothetical protein
VEESCRDTRDGQRCWQVKRDACVRLRSAWPVTIGRRSSSASSESVDAARRDVNRVAYTVQPASTVFWCRAITSRSIAGSRRRAGLASLCTTGQPRDHGRGGANVDAHRPPRVPRADRRVLPGGPLYEDARPLRMALEQASMAIASRLPGASLPARPGPPTTTGFNRANSRQRPDAGRGGCHPPGRGFVEKHGGRRGRLFLEAAWWNTFVVSATSGPSWHPQDTVPDLDPIAEPAARLARDCRLLRRCNSIGPSVSRTACSPRAPITRGGRPARGRVVRISGTHRVLAAKPIAACVRTERIAG